VLFGTLENYPEGHSLFFMTKLKVESHAPVPPRSIAYRSARRISSVP
jgi:hypothetical protein